MSKKRIPKWLADMATELGKEDNKIIMNNNSNSLRQGLSSVSKSEDDLKPREAHMATMGGANSLVPIICNKCKQRQRNKNNINCWNCGEKIK